MSDFSSVWPCSWGTGLRSPRDRRVSPTSASRRPLLSHEAEIDTQRRQADAEDAALAREAKRGGRDAFDALVRRYHARIYTHLFRMMHNREEAEDLTQDTFLRAYRHLAKYDTARPFRNWLYTIATNVGLNALRTRQRRNRLLETETANQHTARSGNTETPTAATNEHADRIAGALEQLPPQSAVLVHLHYHEGMRIREAAEVMGMTENAAKVALCRARKSLRLMLTEGDSP